MIRLSESDIKKGILHPEQLVRCACVEYFTTAFSDDPSVMPLVMEAIGAYGWDDAFGLFSPFTSLVQTEETFLWFVGELEKAGPPTNHLQTNHRMRIAAAIGASEVHLLQRHYQRITVLPEFTDTLRRKVEQRVALLTTDVAEIWRKIEVFCNDGRNKQYIGDVDLSYANRLVEALGRQPESAQRTMAILTQKIDNLDNNPIKWMEPLAIRLAGELRLQEAIPLIVTKLYEDGGDLVNEESVDALTKIGSDAVLEAIIKVFPEAPWHFQLYASSVLENMHSKQVVSECLELYKLEKCPVDIQERLLMVGLRNFSPDGIEPARQWTIHNGGELHEQLLAVAILAGVTFPEQSQWMQEAWRCEQRRTQRYQEMFGDRASPPEPEPEEERVKPIVAAQKVGRNDPCPCGSGKKYKKCCLGKDLDARTS